MLPCSTNHITSCAHELRRLHGDDAEAMVKRQIGWSQSRNADSEVLFWNEVLERLPAGPIQAVQILAHSP